MLDLAYVEDSKADVDMNVVKTGAGLYIELQGTAEALPFGREALNRLLDLADTGIRQLIALQRASSASISARAERQPGASEARQGATARRHDQSRQAARDPVAARRRPARPADAERLPPVAEPEETGDTFEENARLKARLLRRAFRDADGGGRFAAS